MIFRAILADAAPFATARRRKYEEMVCEIGNEKAERKRHADGLQELR